MTSTAEAAVAAAELHAFFKNLSSSVTSHFLNFLPFLANGFSYFFLNFPQIQGMFLYHVLNLVKRWEKMVENSDFDHYFHEFS